MPHSVKSKAMGVLVMPAAVNKKPGGPGDGGNMAPAPASVQPASASTRSVGERRVDALVRRAAPRGYRRSMADPLPTTGPAPRRNAPPAGWQACGRAIDSQPAHPVKNGRAHV